MVSLFRFYSACTSFSITSMLGIWDVVTNEQLVLFIRHEIHEGSDLRTAIENLMDHCLEQYDPPRCHYGGDNMTLIIIGFKNGRTITDWYSWIANGYSQEDLTKYDALFKTSNIASSQVKVEGKTHYIYYTTNFSFIYQNFRITSSARYHWR